MMKFDSTTIQEKKNISIITLNIKRGVGNKEAQEKGEGKSQLNLVLH